MSDKTETDWAYGYFDESKRKFIIFFSTLGFILMVVFGIVNFLNPEKKIVGLLEIIFSFVMLFNIYYFKKSNHSPTPTTTPHNRQKSSPIHGVQ